RLAEPLGAVMADPVQVEQVLINLVVNARDAMPDGGAITIETSNVDVDAREAGHRLPMPPGHYVLLAVHDTGTGMDAKTLARAFEPFFTTKPLGGGTGMGLSTVYGIVKQSGGYIWGESTPRKGASFRIYLPRVAVPAAIAPPSPRASTPAATGSETIVVAEDEPLVRAMTRRTLERAGYRVFDASNGAEALQLVRSMEIPPHLLITDIVMPVMGGRELASTIEREFPGLRILFMSGYTHERQAHLGDDFGVSRFLHKPFSLEELRNRVRLLLDQATSAA
ncbi:MAG: response regulator, partial [Gemmatimonadaceae bacterium]